VLPNAKCVAQKYEDYLNDDSDVIEEHFALLSQTTFSSELFNSIAKELHKLIRNIEVHNTICDATQKRQDSLKRILPICDAIVIAGGKNSANTKRLRDIAFDAGKKAYRVESAGDLIEDIGEFNCVGITAGASTPPELVDEIEEALLNCEPTVNQFPN
jgi:4-hydroxy-3-methylbut-2-enyl diphosphate reductase